MTVEKVLAVHVEATNAVPRPFTLYHRPGREAGWFGRQEPEAPTKGVETLAMVLEGSTLMVKAAEQLTFWGVRPITPVRHSNSSRVRKVDCMLLWYISPQTDRRIDE